MPEITPKIVRSEKLADDLDLRQGLHAAVRYVPFTVTLATTNTSQDIYVTGKQSAYNYIPDSSFETGVSLITEVGATAAQGSNARTGSGTLELTPDNSAVEEGGYWTTPLLAGQADDSNAVYLIVSAYARRGTGSGSDARVVIRDSSGTELAVGNTVTLSTTPQRSVAKYKLPVTAAQYRAAFETVTQHAVPIEFDDVMVETRMDGNASDYVDVDTPELFAFTDDGGETYRVDPLNVITGFQLTSVSHGTYIAFDEDADSVSGINVPASATYSNPVPLHFTKKIAFVNTTGVETPTISGVIFGY